MKKNPLYEILNLKFNYNHNFSLEVPELIINKGTCTGFTGPNGSGKSTLLRMLALLLQPEKGSVKINGKNLYGNNNTDLTISMLFQDPYLLKRNVFDNVAYGLKLRKGSRDLKSKVSDALQLVGLEDKKISNKKWFELSGGEARRVALASRLILKPDVLILDEPTVSLDSRSAILIKDAVEYFIKQFNTTLIISSHDTVWLNSLTANILRINNGRITGAGYENIIQGPWYFDDKDLWIKKLDSKQKIFALNPPFETSSAILNPSDIVLSTDYKRGISAQNILNGKITAMTVTKEQKVNVKIDISGISLTSTVTQNAVKTLHLIPGMDIWVIFKTTALKWQ
ncbi:MAG: ATP-binding cassette domain-containing protein [Spirochaetes bacterium]|nr:ATP-binding cassette domain-containing protein [Spirochaetota bacterium]